MPVLNNTKKGLVGTKINNIFFEMIVRWARSAYPEDKIRSYLNGICESLIVTGKIESYATIPNYQKKNWPFYELRITYNDGIIEHFKLNP